MARLAADTAASRAGRRYERDLLPAADGLLGDGRQRARPYDGPRGGRRARPGASSCDAGTAVRRTGRREIRARAGRGHWSGRRGTAGQWPPAVRAHRRLCGPCRGRAGRRRATERRGLQQRRHPGRSPVPKGLPAAQTGPQSGGGDGSLPYRGLSVSADRAAGWQHHLQGRCRRRADHARRAPALCGEPG